MDAVLHDIESRADCERLVRAFYSRALTDPIIGWLFTDVAKLDLDEHLPVIASFWETILLGERSYSGGAFAPHAVLHAQAGLRGGHFQRWLALWRTTVDELFAGERAELAKAHAERVAQAFQRRLATIPGPGGTSAAGEPGCGDAAGASQAAGEGAGSAGESLGGLLVTQHRPAAGPASGSRSRSGSPDT